MPYTSPIGEIYDSGDFEKVLDKAIELSEWNDFESRKENSQNKGRIRGRGISCYIEWTGAIWFEEVTTEARADGSVVLYTGTQNMGQEDRELTEEKIQTMLDEMANVRKFE